MTYTIIEEESMRAYRIIITLSDDGGNSQQISSDYFAPSSAVAVLRAGHALSSEDIERVELINIVTVFAASDFEL